MSTWQKAEPSHSGAQRRIASAIIKQLITRQITAIARTPRRDATVGSAARRRGPLQTKALYLRSSACKSRLKQLETGRLFFLGHSAKQMNHLFSAAAWLAVAVNSGEPFVCLWPWCAERLFNDCCTWEGFMPRWDVFWLLPLFFLLPASKVNPPSCDFPFWSFKVWNLHLKRWVVQNKKSVRDSVISSTDQLTRTPLRVMLIRCRIFPCRVYIKYGSHCYCLLSILPISCTRNTQIR